jgi:hypothetical protein
MKAETRNISLIVLALFASAVILFTNVDWIRAATFGDTNSTPAQTNTWKHYTFFSTSTNQTIYSTSTTALSTAITTWLDSDGLPNNGAFNVVGAQKVTMYFYRDAGTGGNAGLTRFNVDVSPDGTNWYDWNNLVLDDVSQTATTTVTINAGTSTVIANMDLTHQTFKFIRCQVTEVTDGAHSCAASAQF